MSEPQQPSNAGMDHLREIATQGSEADRIALARDPGTPTEILSMLGQDKSLLVRDFAQSEMRRRAGGAVAPSYPTAMSPAGYVQKTPEQRAGSSAVTAATVLRVFNILLLVLALLGAGILVLAGFVPQCVDGTATCYSYEKEPNLLLSAVGFGSGLGALWLFALANAIAAHVELAGVKARQST